MYYRESPPILPKEKTYVDELVTLFIHSVGHRDKLLSDVFTIEMATPCQASRDKLETIYEDLSEVDTNMDQINIALKTKVKY
jgi:hypothetical protein